MNYLVYGVLRQAAGRTAPELEGIHGAPVRFLEAEGLSAAFSPVPEIPAVPEVRVLLAYARVIESLARIGTVLPMQFGCLLNSEARIHELLLRRRPAFEAALTEIDGCVEMGLRLRVPDTDDDCHCLPAERTEADRMQGHYPATSGAAYLRARKTHYAERHGRRIAVNRRQERLLHAFAGQFVKCSAEEIDDESGRMFSLCFLIRHQDVARFRRSFHLLQETSPETVLLTGPWPPYNFVNSNSFLL